MFWFLTGLAAFFVTNFSLTLVFRRWGLTRHSYTDQWDPESCRLRLYINRALKGFWSLMAHTSIVSLYFKCIENLGYPKAKIFFDGQLIQDLQFHKQEQLIEVPMPDQPGMHVLTVRRYGKLAEHCTLGDDGSIIADQILQITKVNVHRTKVPDFVLDRHSSFQFNDQNHHGSRYFAPNGDWIFHFETPFITWVLDQISEQDRIYDANSGTRPWEYRYAPGQAQQRIQQLQQVIDRVKDLEI